MFDIPAQTSCPGERDAQHTLTTAPFDASLPDTVATDAVPTDATLTPAETTDYKARRRQLLAMAGAGGAALFLMGKTRLAHADGFLFDLKNQRTVLRVADELLDMSVDYFSRANGLNKKPASERQTNALNLALGQDREVSTLLKLLVRKYNAASGGIAQLPNAIAIAKPRPYSFPVNTLKSANEALSFGSLLKDTIVGAFHGSLLSVEDPELLGTLASIAGVQSRHAALIREAAGTDPFPQAFEPALSLKAVSDVLAPYGFTGGGPLS